MSKTARTPYRKRTKTKGRASSANSKKNNVSDAAGAMSSSEQTPVFSRLWNVGSDGDEVTSAGRLFCTRAAATGNARSPTVDRHVARHDECAR